jgi:uncharacterized membrane protein YczE
VTFEIIVGVSISGFFLLVLAFWLHKEHPIMSLLSTVFSILIFINFPHAIDASTHVCEPIVNNSTIISNTTTEYKYIDHCYVSSDAHVTSYLSTMLWFSRLSILYALGFAFYLLYKAVMSKRSKKYGGL